MKQLTAWFEQHKASITASFLLLGFEKDRASRKHPVCRAVPPFTYPDGSIATMTLIRAGKKYYLCASGKKDTVYYHFSLDGIDWEEYWTDFPNVYKGKVDFQPAKFSPERMLNHKRMKEIFDFL